MHSKQTGDYPQSTHVNTFSVVFYEPRNKVKKMPYFDNFEKSSNFRRILRIFVNTLQFILFDIQGVLYIDITYKYWLEYSLHIFSAYQGPQMHKINRYHLDVVPNTCVGA